MCYNPFYDMLEKYLQDIGLSDKEASVYLALLAFDHTSVIELAAKTKINRSTTYVVLESLAKKGLVSETTIGKKTHYQAEPPERLETYVERRKVVLEEQAKRLRDIIPQIKTIQRETGERPIVKYFEGRDGIISANEEFYAMNPDSKEAYLLYSKDLVDDIFTPDERQKYRGVRLGKNIKSKVVYTSKTGDILSDATGTRVKIDGEKYPITCDISVYGDKVKIAILGKFLSCVLIESTDFAGTMKSLVDYIHEHK
ncbi:MAG: helix-turn-helix domain-containing protein [bacterium]|nr:helix-turn-helix domain-containing protein [bacterium]